MNEKKFNNPFGSLKEDISDKQKSSSETRPETGSVKKEDADITGRRAIDKPKKYLKFAGVGDYTYEEKDDGVHFLIKLPQEHIEERKIQKSRLGGLDPTNFTREKIIPFIKLLMDDEKLSYKIVDPETLDSRIFEVVVFKKRK